MKHRKVIKRYSDKWLDHKSFVEEDGKYVLRSARQLMTKISNDKEKNNKTLTIEERENLENENIRKD